MLDTFKFTMSLHTNFRSKKQKTAHLNELVEFHRAQDESVIFQSRVCGTLCAVLPKFLQPSITPCAPTSEQFVEAGRLTKHTIDAFLYVPRHPKFKPGPPFTPNTFGFTLRSLDCHPMYVLHNPESFWICRTLQIRVVAGLYRIFGDGACLFATQARGDFYELASARGQYQAVDRKQAQWLNQDDVYASPNLLYLMTLIDTADDDGFNLLRLPKALMDLHQAYHADLPAFLTRHYDALPQPEDAQHEDDL